MSWKYARANGEGGGFGGCEILNIEKVTSRAEVGLGWKTRIRDGKTIFRPAEKASLRTVLRVAAVGGDGW